MPDDGNFPWLWILLGIQTALLVLLWIGQLIHGARLRRILRHLRAGAVPEARRQRIDGHATPGHFETWVMEDPARREMPKKEQFAAYRQWRAEQGLTWSGPASED